MILILQKVRDVGRCNRQFITLDVPDVRQYNRQVISQFDGKKFSIPETEIANELFF